METIEYENMKKQVKEVVAAIGNIEEEEIRDDAMIYDDLLMDSMKILEIVSKIEKSFRVLIPEDDIPTFARISDIYLSLSTVLGVGLASTETVN